MLTLRRTATPRLVCMFAKLTTSPVILLSHIHMYVYVCMYVLYTHSNAYHNLVYIRTYVCTVGYAYVCVDVRDVYVCSYMY